MLLLYSYWRLGKKLSLEEQELVARDLRAASVDTGQFSYFNGEDLQDKVRDSARQSRHNSCVQEVLDSLMTIKIVDYEILK